MPRHYHHLQGRLNRPNPTPALCFETFRGVTSCSDVPRMVRALVPAATGIPAWRITGNLASLLPFSNRINWRLNVKLLFPHRYNLYF